MNSTRSRKPWFPIAAVFVTGVITPLLLVSRSPHFDAIRAVDLVLVFAAGASAGALLSLIIRTFRQRQSPA